MLQDSTSEMEALMKERYQVSGECSDLRRALQAAAAQLKVGPLLAVTENTCTGLSVVDTIAWPTPGAFVPVDCRSRRSWCPI